MKDKLDFKKSNLKIFENTTDLVQAIIDDIESPKAIKKLLAETNTSLITANNLNVTSTESHTTAAQQIKTNSKQKNIFKDAVKDYKGKANDVHKGISGYETIKIKVFDEIETILKRKISDHLLKEKEKQEELQKKIDQKARDIEEKERKKLFKKAAKAEKKGSTSEAEILQQEAVNYRMPSVLIEQPLTTILTQLGKTTSKLDFTIEIIPGHEITVMKSIINGLLPITAIQFDLKIMKEHIQEKVPECDLKNISYPGLKIIPEYKTR